MNIFIVIPVYNEEKKILDVVGEVLKHYSQVVVVDDGSTDDTPYLLETNPNIINCRHIINRGQGAALRTGTLKALELGADIIVHFDADGQMRVQDIARVIEPIIEEHYQVVLGSRFLGEKSNIPFTRKIVLWGAKIFNQYIMGIDKRIKDPQSGFRALSRTAAKNIAFSQDRMAHCSEILGIIVKQHLKYTEVPVTITYSDYSLQKGQKAKNAFTILWSLLVGKILK